MLASVPLNAIVCVRAAGGGAVLGDGRAVGDVFDIGLDRGIRRHAAVGLHTGTIGDHGIGVVIRNDNGDRARELGLGRVGLGVAAAAVHKLRLDCQSSGEDHVLRHREEVTTLFVRVDDDGLGDLLVVLLDLVDRGQAALLERLVRRGVGDQAQFLARKYFQTTLGLVVRIASVVEYSTAALAAQLELGGRFLLVVRIIFIFDPGDDVLGALACLVVRTVLNVVQQFLEIQIVGVSGGLAVPNAVQLVHHGGAVVGLVFHEESDILLLDLDKILSVRRVAVADILYLIAAVAGVIAAPPDRLNLIPAVGLDGDKGVRIFCAFAGLIAAVLEIDFNVRVLFGRIIDLDGLVRARDLADSLRQLLGLEVLIAVEPPVDFFLQPGQHLICKQLDALFFHFAENALIGLLNILGGGGGAVVHIFLSGGQYQDIAASRNIRMFAQFGNCVLQHHSHTDKAAGGIVMALALIGNACRLHVAIGRDSNIAAGLQHTVHPGSRVVREHGYRQRNGRNGGQDTRVRARIDFQFGFGIERDILRGMNLRVLCNIDLGIRERDADSQRQATEFLAVGVIADGRAGKRLSSDRAAAAADDTGVEIVSGINLARDIDDRLSQLHIDQIDARQERKHAAALLDLSAQNDITRTVNGSVLADRDRRLVVNVDQLRGHVQAGVKGGRGKVFALVIGAVEIPKGAPVGAGAVCGLNQYIVRLQFAVNLNLPRTQDQLQSAYQHVCVLADRQPVVADCDRIRVDHDSGERQLRICMNADLLHIAVWHLEHIVGEGQLRLIGEAPILRGQRLSELVDQSIGQCADVLRRKRQHLAALGCQRHALLCAADGVIVVVILVLLQLAGEIQAVAAALITLDGNLFNRIGQRQVDLRLVDAVAKIHGDLIEPVF